MKRSTPFGQTLVELALVLPLFVMVVTGIIVLGVGVFYQQQLTNAAREAARYASINSATAQCPTVPRLPYNPQSSPLTYTRCDRPEEGWPKMTRHARDAVFGLDRAAIQISACWSGYRMNDSGAYDAPPPSNYEPPLGEVHSTFAQCSIDGHDPTSDVGSIACRPGLPTTDQASAISEAPGRTVANTVTAYACYVWRPPLAGFLLIPAVVTQRAVVTEPIERQQ
jgi:hypothetical protein